MRDDRDYFDPNNPDNIDEIEMTETEILEQDYLELCQRVKIARAQIKNLLEIAENFENGYFCKKLKQIKL